MKKDSLSKEIRQFRQEREITQEDLAKFLGVARITVLRWENNRTRMSNLARDKLEHLFQIHRCPTCGHRI